MSKWIPFEDVDVVYLKTYFVTLKHQPHIVECVTGRQLIGSTNVLAAMEVETPDPYVPPGMQAAATTTIHFPLVEKPQNSGMLISLPGVLNRAADHCKRSRDSDHLEFPLKELLRHIEHLRCSESDQQALQRLESFLRVWVN